MSDFPDYEAASVAFIDKLKDIAPNNVIIALDVDMRMIVAAVDAASDDMVLYVRCPSGCDLGEYDDSNHRWDCDTCAGMGFVKTWPKDSDDE